MKPGGGTVALGDGGGKSIRLLSEIANPIPCAWLQGTKTLWIALAGRGRLEVFQGDVHELLAVRDGRESGRNPETPALGPQELAPIYEKNFPPKDFSEVVDLRGAHTFLFVLLRSRGLLAFSLGRELTELASTPIPDVESFQLGVFRLRLVAQKTVASASLARGTNLAVQQKELKETRVCLLVRTATQREGKVEKGFTIYCAGPGALLKLDEGREEATKVASGGMGSRTAGAAFGGMTCLGPDGRIRFHSRDWAAGHSSTPLSDPTARQEPRFITPDFSMAISARDDLYSLVQGNLLGERFRKLFGGMEARRIESGWRIISPRGEILELYEPPGFGLETARGGPIVIERKGQKGQVYSLLGNEKKSLGAISLESDILSISSNGLALFCHAGENVNVFAVCPGVRTDQMLPSISTHRCPRDARVVPIGGISFLQLGPGPVATLISAPNSTYVIEKFEDLRSLGSYALLSELIEQIRQTTDPGEAEPTFARTFARIHRRARTLWGLREFRASRLENAFFLFKSASTPLDFVVGLFSEIGIGNAEIRERLRNENGFSPENGLPLLPYDPSSPSLRRDARLLFHYLCDELSSNSTGEKISTNVIMALVFALSKFSPDPTEYVTASEVLRLCRNDHASLVQELGPILVSVEFNVPACQFLAQFENWGSITHSIERSSQFAACVEGSSGWEKHCDAIYDAMRLIPGPANDASALVARLCPEARCRLLNRGLNVLVTEQCLLEEGSRSPRLLASAFRCQSLNGRPRQDLLNQACEMVGETRERQFLMVLLGRTHPDPASAPLTEAYSILWATYSEADPSALPEPPLLYLSSLRSVRLGDASSAYSRILDSGGVGAAEVVEALTDLFPETKKDLIGLCLSSGSLLGLAKLLVARWPAEVTALEALDMIPRSMPLGLAADVLSFLETEAERRRGEADEESSLVSKDCAEMKGQVQSLRREAIHIDASTCCSHCGAKIGTCGSLRFLSGMQVCQECESVAMGYPSENAPNALPV